MKINISNIDLIVYDFDGVMTDNRVLVFEDGKEAVYCNRSDGLAISQIKALAIPQIILSTEKNLVVAVRARKVGIDVIHGVDDKKVTLVHYCEEHDYVLDNVVYIGNDTNDLEVMKIVGYPLCPSDASSAIQTVAKCVLDRRGGEGVIKAFYENMLKI